MASSIVMKMLVTRSTIWYSNQHRRVGRWKDGVMISYPRGHQYVIIPPQPMAAMYFAPYPKRQECCGANEECPYPPIDLFLRIHELHVGPSPDISNTGGAGGGSRAGTHRLVPGEEVHNIITITIEKEREGGGKAVLLSTVKREEGR